ncbi:MAG TPA: rhomboid family intramembrane serine protease [Polyangiaceae bacterium]|jgi:membrane associated rhomboid family serine protease|nr:rhomboid family intramembrane serine protease [Polyangiaceae bacterium]
MPPNYSGDNVQFVFPKPGRVVMTLICVIGGVWLAFAVGMHWAGVPGEVFALFCGNTAAILHGQVWRLFTAPLMHAPNSFWHVLGVLFTLYFFATALEAQWKRARFLRFLLALALLPGLAQMAVELALPARVSAALSGDYWFGGFALASGITVAWAFGSNSGSVWLFGVVPVPPRVLVILVVASPFVYLILGEPPPEGIAGLLAGCLGGWLLGGGTPSPLRRYWLKFRIGRLDAEVEREAAQRRKRAERSQLKVIEGGRGKSEDENPRGRGPDGRWLN